MKPSNCHAILIGLVFKIFALNAWGAVLKLTPSYIEQGIQRIDCPDLGLNIGDPCDDKQNHTQNDMVQSNCKCLGVDINDEDLDMDGFTKELDCDDTNPDINPNMQEIPDNGIDEDCSGTDLTQSTDPDSDKDGTTLGNGDCDDSNPNIYPGAQEILGNGIDENCDGVIDDIISSLQENKAKSNFDVFPNPTSVYLQIEFRIPPSKAFQIQISDMLGKVVHQQYINQLNGASIKINTKPYSNGFYILSIIQPGQMLSKKILCLN